MSLFLTLAFLFFIGSVAGWFLELFYRNLKRKGGKWINPGFCTGPYVPLYGSGLCIIYLIASLDQYHLIPNETVNQLVLLLCMAVGMTAIEYIAGILLLKVMKLRLWDYSNCWGNVQGLICPAFSAAWAVLCAGYFYLVHPHILNALEWLSNNLAFSFVIGMFFGVFIIDFCHSAHLTVMLKKFAEDNRVIVKYEAVKEHIRSAQASASAKYRFFRPLHGERELSEYLKEMHRLHLLDAIRSRKERKKS